VSLKLILLDRDGVINQKIAGGYVNSLETFTLMPGIFEFLKLIEGYKIRTAIVTNQQGLGKHVTSYTNFYHIQGFFADECVKQNITPPALFYCPHIADTCQCRKPDTGLLRAATSTFDVSEKECLLVGDSESDIESANRMGIPSIHFGSSITCHPLCTAQHHVNDFETLGKIVREFRIHKL
jgi:D-glycero-D-manno-heptose 1,7-bisphosphate phosphatase